MFFWVYVLNDERNFVIILQFDWLHRPSIKFHDWWKFCVSNMKSHFYPAILREIISWNCINPVLDRRIIGMSLPWISIANPSSLQTNMLREMLENRVPRASTRTCLRKYPVINTWQFRDVFLYEKISAACLNSLAVLSFRFPVLNNQGTVEFKWVRNEPRWFFFCGKCRVIRGTEKWWSLWIFRRIFYFYLKYSCFDFKEK